MPTSELTSLKRETIQSQVRREESSGLTLMLWLASGEGLVSPWWSVQRDRELRGFWRKPDQLAGAVYTLESRLSTIPVNIRPLDSTVRSSAAQAEKFQYMLDNLTEFGQGWDTFISKWVEDLLTQDNGAFCEIIGDGDPLGPVLGMPYGIASLDSARCQRTPDPEFPVIYQDISGSRYKLHYTRVAFAALQPSPAAEMLGVGYCAVSRCLNTAQHLLDILVYKQEKLGSRPHRNIIITKGGLDPSDVTAAFQLGEEKMDNQALTRYSKSIVIGNSNLPEAALETVDLATLPDGFDEETSTTLGMAAIALAFGVDARELWPSMSTGATRADALVSHLKARMKGIGQLIQITERALGPKLLPPTLSMIFDYQDDAQDHEVANIRKVRSERHATDLTSGVVDVRTARVQMLNDGDLTQGEFDEVELADGRLPDGASVLTLFYTPDFDGLLDLGVPDPVSAAGPELKPLIAEKRAELLRAVGRASQYKERLLLRQALAALEALEDAGAKRTPPSPPEPVGARAQTEEPTGEGETPSDDVTVSEDGEMLEESEVSEGEEEAVAGGSQEKALALVRGALGLVSPVYRVPAGAMPPAPIIIQNPNDALLERLATALENGNVAMTKALKERNTDLFRSQGEMLVLAIEEMRDKQALDTDRLVGMTAAVGGALDRLVAAIRSIKPTVNVNAEPVIKVEPTPVTLSVAMPTVTEEEVSVVERDYSGKVNRIRRKRTYGSRGG